MSAVHAGESTVEIETEADSNDITETADPLHDNCLLYTSDAADE